MKARTLVALLAVVALLAPAPAAQAMKDWTVLVFMVGDDDSDHPIEDSQINDLLELDSVGSTAEVNLLVQMDRGTKLTSKMKRYYGDPDYSGAVRYRITRGKWMQEAKLGEVNCGDPMTLYDAMRWAAESYPARRYAVIINAHGSGVLTWNGVGGVGSATPGAVDFPYADPMTAYDDTNKDSLSVFEIAAVLDAFRDRLNGGRPLDVLGLDSCLSGMAEVVYQLRDRASYFVASPTLVPGSGFDYDAFAARLVRDPGMDGRSAAEDIVETFIDSVGRNGQSDVLAAWDTSRADELQQAWNDFARELLRARQAGAKLSFQKLSNYSDRYWDLSKIARAVIAGRSGVAAAPNYARCVAAAEALESARRAARVSLWYDGSFAEAEVGGLSIYWPEADEYRKYRNFYKALDSSKAGFWDEFLDVRELGMSYDLAQ